MRQTKLPDELIIVDGSSKDNTLTKIKQYVQLFSEAKSTIKVLIKKGNRSVGRNEAIKNTSNDIILCTDAGNVLDTKWIVNIIKQFQDKSVDVVAGYYKGKASTIFEKCLVPYVLVMEDRVNPRTFLPATRSMAFRKKIWEEVGGFPEQFSHNEDYVFAKKIKDYGAKIIFVRDAIVEWLPRNNYKSAFVMFFRFAYGDIEAGIVRRKVLLIFVRYVLGITFLLSGLLLHPFYSILLSISFIFYVIWAIMKNYKYVKHSKAIFILPILQLTSDIAVLAGSFIAFLKKYTVRKVFV